MKTKTTKSETDRAAVGKMSDLLNANGFQLVSNHNVLFSQVWRRQCGTIFATEVRLYDDRFFRITAEDGFELAIGVGITDLRSALLRIQAVR